MNDNLQAAALPPAATDDEEIVVNAVLIGAIEEAIAGGDSSALSALTSELSGADLADVIAHLDASERMALISLLGDDLDLEALVDLDTSVRDQIFEDLPNERIAEIVRELDSDDAVYLIEDMDEADQSEILSRLPDSERAALERSLEYPEDSAGRLMKSDFIAVPPFWSVGQTIDYMRDTDDLPDEFDQLFVVDPAYHPLGTVSLDRLLRTKRPILIEQIMDPDVTTVDAGLDQEEVARLFERNDLSSAPVIDSHVRLVGVITIDDVVDVIHEEAEEDIKRLGGVGDESVSDSVLDITRSRFIWLLVNLGTAVLASLVIGLFDATIEQMVALAVLMPIVASMGGNAATQTMTVAVRALATKELSVLNAGRIISRETVVGMLNGMMFAAIMGLVAWGWFGSQQLGLIIGLAMVINMLAAGLAGILIPIALDRAGVDPAVASSVFVTTVTDVVGFFAFLGLAALWLI